MVVSRALQALILFIVFSSNSSAANVGEECRRKLRENIDPATFSQGPGWSMDVDNMEGRGHDPGFSVAFNDRGVIFKNNQYKGIDAVWDDLLQTARFQSTRGFIVENSRFVMPFYHGNGAVTSHSGTGLNAIHMFSNLLHSDKTSGSTGKIKAMTSSRILGSSYSVDFPKHGLGSMDEKFNNLDTLVEWVASDLKRAKESGLMVVPMARSGSTGILAEVNLRYPGLIDGMILMSGVHPDHLDVALEWVKMASEKRVGPHQDRAFRPNWANIHWIMGLYRHLTWHQQERPFGDTPTMMIFGADDPQVSAQERKSFEAIVNKAQGDSMSDVRMVVVPKAHHDVLAQDKGWEAVVKFIEEVVYLKPQTQRENALEGSQQNAEENSRVNY